MLDQHMLRELADMVEVGATITEMQEFLKDCGVPRALRIEITDMLWSA